MTTDVRGTRHRCMMHAFRPTHSGENRVTRTRRNSTSDERRENAARPVGRSNTQTRKRELVGLAADGQDVDRLFSGEVAAFDKGGARSHFANGARSGPRVFDLCDACAREHLRLRCVCGDEPRSRNERAS